MAMIGNLQDFSFAELLQILGRGNKSGQLSVWTPSGVSHIWFYQGRVIAASPPADTLGLQHQFTSNPELKTHCGGSSEQVLARLAALCCPINQPLGACLRKQGLISTASLATVFRKQLQEGVYPLFELEAGQFNFNAKAPIPYGEMTGLSKECLDVAIEGLRRVHTQNQGHTHYLPGEESCFSRRSDDLPLARLSPLEWTVWERVSPERRLRELAFELESDLREIQQTCGRLLRVGLIQEARYAPHSDPDSQPTIGSVARLDPQPSSQFPSSSDAEVSHSLLNRLTLVLRGIQKNGRQAYSGSAR